MFLRIGEWAVSDYDDGNTWVTLLHPDWIITKHGPSQRIEHIDILIGGSSGYATVLKFDDSGEKIRSFDDQFLLKLGKPVKEKGFVYSKVLGKVSVDDLVTGSRNSGKPANEILTISRSSKSKTERKTLISARMGQGVFRSNVLSLWDYCCAVTGSTTPTSIRASHIKPWKVSNNSQRLDPYNGLPLVATFDALFDGGLISFGNDGKIIISNRLTAKECKRLAVRPTHTIGKVHSKTKRYLEYHRSNVFLNDSSAG